MKQIFNNLLKTKLLPSNKILLLILWLVITFKISVIWLQIVLFISVILLFGINNNYWKLNQFKNLFLFIGFITFVLWVLYFYFSYKPVGKVEYLLIFKQSFYLGLRLINMLLVGLLFLSNTEIEEIQDGLIMLRVPYPIAFTFTLSFRLVSSFINTGFLIVEAQKIRGNNIDEGFILSRMKKYVPLLVPLIINGIKKAKNTYLALESKGFSPNVKINIEGKYKKTYKDSFAILSSIILLSFCFII